MTGTGLYIHIPFCVQKCHYCAFASAPAAEETIAAYFNALWREIDSWKDKEKPMIRTVYFGGGTPSFPPEQYITKTMAKLGEIFDFDPLSSSMEKTIEVNPVSAAEDKLKAYAAAGFNRLSVGLQAGQDHLLKSIGRAHIAADFSATMAAASRYFDNISADVIFGLPEQTLYNIEETLRMVTDFPAVKHVSCYSLSVEPGTVFEKRMAEGRLLLPDEDTERRMYYFIRDFLKAKGIEQYEISNFALPGYESRHNSSYWELTPYIGFGLSAASLYNNERKTNTADLKKYIAAVTAGDSPAAERHILSLEEQKGDFMFLGLRRSRGVSDADYRQLFGCSFREDFGGEIDGLKGKELIEEVGEYLRLTLRGTDLANQVFMAFV